MYRRDASRPNACERGGALRRRLPRPGRASWSDERRSFGMARRTAPCVRTAGPDCAGAEGAVERGALPIECRSITIERHSKRGHGKMSRIVNHGLGVEEIAGRTSRKET